MSNQIIHLTKRAVCLALSALPCLAIAQEKAPESVYGCPEETIRGIRYFEKSNIADQFVNYDNLGSLRYWGFALNPDNEDTYITPDGKVIPAFYNALWVAAPNEENPGRRIPDGALPYYVGDVYLPDFIEGFASWKDEYVLAFNYTAMADRVTSIRTPLYMPVSTNCLGNAVNLQKVQIGACHSVEPCAFWYCKKLETVIIEKSPYIYRFAFAGCPTIKDVVLQSASELPPFEDASAFDDSVYKNATLYLHDDLMDECGKDPVWSKFVHRKSLKECKVEPVKR